MTYSKYSELLSQMYEIDDVDEYMKMEDIIQNVIESEEEDLEDAI